MQKKSDELKILPVLWNDWFNPHNRVTKKVRNLALGNKVSENQKTGSLTHYFEAFWGKDYSHKDKDCISSVTNVLFGSVL